MRKIVIAAAGVAVLACVLGARLRAPKFEDANGALLKTAAWRAQHPLKQVIHNGQILGVLQVPRLGLAVPFVEGSEGAPLNIGAGHIPRTAFPGHHGNAGIAAHRDTCFRPLRFVKPNDDIVITTPEGSYDYKVSGYEIVGPHDGQVLSRTPGRTLTLVTCYPFFYPGSAPQRFIVHAREYGARAG